MLTVLMKSVFSTFMMRVQTDMTERGVTDEQHKDSLSLICLYI